MNGELESRLLYYKEIVEDMEIRSANRVGLTLTNYQDRIINEWWERGHNAVKANVADEVVVVKCADELLTGTILKKIFSFFGARTLEFSKCPLITAPISTGKRESNNVTKTAADVYFELLYFDKRNFINNYVSTGLFN